jgi:hypothetical protein
MENFLTSDRLIVGKISLVDWTFELPFPSRAETLADRSQVGFYSIGMNIYVAPFKPDSIQTFRQLYKSERDRRPVSSFDLIEEKNIGLARFCYRAPSARTATPETPALCGVIIGENGSQITLGIHFEAEETLPYALNIWRSFAQGVQ